MCFFHPGSWRIFQEVEHVVVRSSCFHSANLIRITMLVANTQSISTFNPKMIRTLSKWAWNIKRGNAAVFSRYYYSFFLSLFLSFVLSFFLLFPSIKIELPRQRERKQQEGVNFFVQFWLITPLGSNFLFVFSIKSLPASSSQCIEHTHQERQSERVCSVAR